MERMKMRRHDDEAKESYGSDRRFTEREKEEVQIRGGEKERMVETRRKKL